jgi:hypothetical protein
MGQLWFNGLGSLKGCGRFRRWRASGCSGILGNGLGFGSAAGLGGGRTRGTTISAISMASILPDVGWQNQRGETVSTPPQDFAAQRFWAQEPLSCAHPFRGHPLSTCLRLKGVLTNFLQL